MLAFTEENEAKFQEIVGRFPPERRMAATLPTLWLCQEQWGWLSPDAMEYAAKRLELPASHVLGVATFYTMYFTRPVGQHVLEVCNSVSCCLTGGTQTLEYLCEKLGIEEGGTSADGKWTVRRAECLGSCDTSPMMQVDNDYFVEHLTPEKVDKLVNELAERPWGSRSRLASFCAAGERRS